MTPEDKEYLLALLGPIREDVNDIKRRWEQDVSAISSRLNILDTGLAVMQAKAEVRGGLFGAGTGLVFGILGEIIAARLL